MPRPALVRGAALAAALALGGCSRAAPPSVVPTAADAVARMRATSSCNRGAQAESKVDYFGDLGRVRGSTLFVTSRPDKVRFDVFSPFGVNLSTLTSNGSQFALLDFTGKRFFVGPARECNVARFLHVPVPPHALVTLLAGEAPLLVHAPPAATLEWSGGSYVVRVDGKHDAHQTIRLLPVPQDWNKPWQEQRMRVVEVSIVQQGIELYKAELDGFEPAKTAAPRVDPDGIDPDIPPSGPECHAELPRRVHITSEVSGEDVLLVHSDVVHNPPLQPGLFEQKPPAGVKIVDAYCR